MRAGGRKAQLFEDCIMPEPNSGCWLWTGSLNHSGYGMLWNGIKQVRAHRWSYETFREPIPDGMVLDHLCRVRCCVNPYHLEITTTGENVRRGEPGQYKARQTHCPNGHELTPENIRWRKKKNSIGETVLYRHCRICFRKTNTDAKRKWWRLNKSSQARNQIVEV